MVKNAPQCIVFSIGIFLFKSWECMWQVSKLGCRNQPLVAFCICHNYVTSGFKIPVCQMNVRHKLIFEVYIKNTGFQH
jgi:hypothetical protein